MQIRPGKKPPFMSFRELAEMQAVDDWARSVYVSDIFASATPDILLDDFLVHRLAERLREGLRMVEEVDGRRTIIVRVTIDKEEL